MNKLNVFEKFTIIYGHYGSGKTNLSINLALSLASTNKKVTIVDLDVVNPYFRSGDYKEFLSKHNIDVISPQSLGTNMDTPSLSPQIYSVFADTSRYTIVDVGGDDVGAYALGRFSKEINSLEKYNAYYVINKYRALTSTPQEAKALLSEIEEASKIKATAIINNSHLQNLTTKETILNSLDYAKQTAKLLKLPVALTSCPKNIYCDMQSENLSLLPVDIIVKPPFN